MIRVLGVLTLLFGLLLVGVGLAAPEQTYTEIEIVSDSGEDGVPYEELSDEEKELFTGALSGSDGFFGSSSEHTEGVHFEDVTSVEYNGVTYSLLVEYDTRHPTESGVSIGIGIGVAIIGLGTAVIGKP